MLAVNVVLTVAQLFCGVVANSLSLLGDGALMAVDSLCYGVGLYAERVKEADPKRADYADRLGAMFSAAMLVATTIWVLLDVLDRLIGDDSREEPGLPGGGRIAEVVQNSKVQVNGALMIAFTAVNLVADGLVALACWRFGAMGGASSPPSESPAGGTPEAGCGETCSVPAVQEANSKGDSDDNLNIFGAFAHLAADGVRGVAVLICGILAVAGVVDAGKADAYCSLFVCIFVLAAAGSFMRVVLRKTAPVAYEEIEEPEASAAPPLAHTSAALESPTPPQPMCGPWEDVLPPGADGSVVPHGHPRSQSVAVPSAQPSPAIYGSPMAVVENRRVGVTASDREGA